MSLSHPLVCLGHSLLDISAAVSVEMFEKYGVRAGNAILAEEKHMPIFKELVDNYPCDFIAGGASQNTCRAAQWLSRTENFTGFIGVVGEDEYSQHLRDSVKAAGVNAYYQVEPTVPTGTCACLIHEKERSLIANLAAAQMLKLDYLRSIWHVIENCSVIYAEGYMFSSAVDCVVESAKYACENGKIFTMNVSAQFIIEFFREPMMRAWPYCEYVFGNEDETQKFGEVFGFGSDVVEAAKQMSLMPTNTPRPKKIVVTRGKDTVLIACEGKVTEYNVPLIPSEKVLDLNGAGDSFVGGFLCELIKGGSYERCVAAGNYLASEVIQLSGCSFPAVPSFN
ncbi:hypothetical protein SteCoe_7008 [Stentor coeruleus]|uniref:Adenosine kinase n=1 Tax=Stentor coeruleus TaxID=5963 RepID=A0A1R2CNK9_9CILI|nr:hypothetical protein SteCoe_7008 [Stentor coeruleus]